MFTLIHENQVSKDKYTEYMNKISEVKLDKYDAYAQVISLAIVFRQDDPSLISPEEEALQAYAVHINQVSAEIDAWLRNLYCFPARCMQTGQTQANVAFSSYDSFLRLQRAMQVVQEDAQSVSEMLVAGIRNVE